MSARLKLSLVSITVSLLISSCSPPPNENTYRQGKYYPGGLDVPVAFLTSEWAGKSRVMASGWLVEGSNGVLLSAKHFSDVFMEDIIELGGKECKAFLAGKVYDCSVVQVPPLRDAVLLKLLGDTSNLPKPYKIAEEEVKVGETLFIEGAHPHPRGITESNEKEGFKDRIVPILRTFYELRVADPSMQREVSFDVLEARVVEVDSLIQIDSENPDPFEGLKYQKNKYIKVITARNHKFSFGGLSGGVAVRINKNGEKEAVGIITAERPVRIEYDSKGEASAAQSHIAVADTILITPISSVKDLQEYAKTLR